MRGDSVDRGMAPPEDIHLRDEVWQCGCLASRVCVHRGVCVCLAQGCAMRSTSTPIAPPMNRFGPSKTLARPLFPSTLCSTSDGAEIRHIVSHLIAQGVTGYTAVITL
jgi:hypothetical protein